jgi:putative ABC transport system ATP-binding protein
MTAVPPVRVRDVNHFFGSGALRKQTLFDVSLESDAGEIVILTGPSGSGKTTLLTLVGALRQAQQGSVSILGRELRGARNRTLVEVRREIGFIFQLHNLIESLSAVQNVEMVLALHDGPSRERRRRATSMLEAVGLGDHLDQRPESLSGGQKQRVAIARALVNEPRLILADEPTASLDRKSGREVVDLIQRLAREQGVSVVLVTHDNRILDIADRIVHLEDGRITPFGDAVAVNAQQLLRMASRSGGAELRRGVAAMSGETFAPLLEEVTRQSQEFIEALRLAGDGAFETMLDYVLEAFTDKIGSLLSAERASLFLVDEARGELWSKVARDVHGEMIEIRIPRTAGVAGSVFTSGTTENIPDAYADPRFDSNADRESGFVTRGILCVPLRDAGGEIFGVAQALNKQGGGVFAADDIERFETFMRSMSVILESWWQLSRVSSRHVNPDAC